jgi:hypothetical protein
MSVKVRGLLYECFVTGVVSALPNPQAGGPLLVRFPWMLIQYIRSYPLYLGEPGKRSRYSDSLRAGRSGDRIPVRRDFLHLSRPASGPTQPPVQWVPGLSWGQRQPGRDADHTPPSSAEVKKELSYTSTHPMGPSGHVTEFPFFTLYIWGSSSIRNLRTCHAVVKGTKLIP